MLVGGCIAGSLQAALYAMHVHMRMLYFEDITKNHKYAYTDDDEAYYGEASITPEVIDLRPSHLAPTG